MTVTNQLSPELQALLTKPGNSGSDPSSEVANGGTALTEKYKTIRFLTLTIYRLAFELNNRCQMVKKRLYIVTIAPHLLNRPVLSLQKHLTKII